MLGVLGDDNAGEELRELLDQQGIETDGLLVDPERPTTLKTRIVAHHQQVVRFDKERTDALSAAMAKRLLEIVRCRARPCLGRHLRGLRQGRAHADVARSRWRAVPIAPARLPPPIRTRGIHCDSPGLTAITPNRSEAFAAARVPYSEPIDEVLRDEPLMRVGKILLRQWRPKNLLITLGEHGMCLFRSGQKPHHIPTVAQEVFDVSGAGDTAIATLVLALAAGANPVEAAEISNHAAGVVVGKIGTATCSTEELVESFARNKRH